MKKMKKRMFLISFLLNPCSFESLVSIITAAYQGSVFTHTHTHLHTHKHIFINIKSKEIKIILGNPRRDT